MADTTEGIPEEGAQPPETNITPLVRDLIAQLGEDPAREGLLNTPERVDRSLRFLTNGYQRSLEEVVNGALFRAEGREMVVVKGIEFYSLCEHHMLPFVGVAHVGYLPGERIVGLSKLARVVDFYTHRTQRQERLTKQVAEHLRDHLRPRGVGVVIQAEHTCMSQRGVRAAGSRTVTSALFGALRDNPASRAEFLGLVHGRKEA